MLLRALVGVKDRERLRVMERVLNADEDIAQGVHTEAAMWRALRRDEFDLLILDRAFLGSEPSAQVSTLRGLPDAPEIVVLIEREDAKERAALLASGALAAVNVHLSEEALKETLRALVSRRRAESVHRQRAQSFDAENRLTDFAAQSAAMRRVIATARRVASTDSSLLILGETGVGKEWLARAMHAEGPRAHGPFVAVNCAALPEQLLESELFGHERGAFTGAVRARRGHFEMAHRGTIFLDEVAEMPPHLQVKLLRVLQEHRIQRVGGERTLAVDVRIMAATNREAAREIAAGRLRPDLYYRLGVVTITLPPLRERSDDILALARGYFERFRVRFGREVSSLSAEAEEALMRYAWPGNVRELINVMERAVLLSAGPEITLSDLPDDIARTATEVRPALAPGAPPMPLLPLRAARVRAVEEFERDYLSDALRAAGGRIGEAAARAGLSPRALHAKMKRLGLRKEDFRYRP